MTVHGAKGLEAPVVILADATADPAKLGSAAATARISRFGGVGSVPLLRPEEGGADAAVRRADRRSEEARDLEEHWRLLYVALTRASERLVVAGVEPKPRKDGAEHAGTAQLSGRWHRSAQCDEPMTQLGRRDALSRRSVRRRGVAEDAPRAAPERPLPCPDWARTPAPAEARPPRPLAPSAIAEDDEAVAAAERGACALRRGAEP